MKTICHMYLLAPPNLLPNFQLPFKLLPLWKLGGERGPSLNHYHHYRKLYFAKQVSLCERASTSELNMRAGGDR